MREKSQRASEPDRSSPGGDRHGASARNKQRRPRGRCSQGDATEPGLAARLGKIAPIGVGHFFHDMFSSRDDTYSLVVYLYTKVSREKRPSHPLDRVPGHLQEPCLTGALLGLVVVEPRGGLGHRHEDALDTGARGLEAELGASVVDQVELDITASADLLPLLLLGRVGHVLALGDEREVRRKHGVEAGLGHLETALGRETVEVVVEDAADATRLAPVRDVEVPVAPGLELRIEVCAEGIERLLVLLMEVAGVLFVEVARGEVRAAAEPPRLRCAVRVDDLEVAVVQVHRWRVRVPRVQNHAQAAGKEADGALGRRLDVLVVVLHALDGARRERSVHYGHVHACLLERRPVRKHHRPPATAVVPPDPLVWRKLLRL